MIGIARVEVGEGEAVVLEAAAEVVEEEMDRTKEAEIVAGMEEDAGTPDDSLQVSFESA